MLRNKEKGPGFKTHESTQRMREKRYDIEDECRELTQKPRKMRTRGKSRIDSDSLEPDTSGSYSKSSGYGPTPSRFTHTPAKGNQGEARHSWNPTN
jgi:hypothetical protein